MFTIVHYRSHINICFSSIGLSPYLNFGHISPIEVLITVRDASVPEEAKDLFFERVFVQRELAINGAWFNLQYDTLYGGGLPNWALITIESTLF